MRDQAKKCGGWFLRRIAPARAMLFCLTLAAPPVFAQTQFTAAVDPTMVIVTNFEGWGTSLCWWANVCGGYANRETYAQMAFTTLKLNIVRYNIGGGENPNLANTMEFRARMQGFEPGSNVWNWQADANQRWMLRRAVALGANRVVAFANSPPWWMTVSGSVTGAVGGTNNLRVADESLFAQYLATVVSNLAMLDNVHFDFTTPINEPMGTWWTYGGRQEGCHMDAAQQSRVVGDYRAALDAQGVTAGIDASEDNDEQDAVNSLNAYGAAQNSVALVASHTYGANNPGGLAAIAAALRKPAWISEYGDGDATGLTMARRIHDDITGVWARAWVYWQVVDNGGGWGFLYNPLDGSGNAAITVNKKFYVMAQFSQFIRPGSQIFNVNDHTSLAAWNPANQTLAIVAVNDSTNTVVVRYDLGAFTNLPPVAAFVRTSPRENLVAQPALAVTNRSFTASLIPQSVATFILTNAVPAPPAQRPRAWYRFERNANDDSGDDFNGTSSAVSFTAGKLGLYAAQFNGTSSYVRIPLVISNDFTISFWLKTTDSGAAGQWWAGKGLVDGEVQGTANDFGVSLVGDKVALGLGNPDTTITTADAVNDGQWHHIAATRDAVSGRMSIYVDGVPEAAGDGPIGTRTDPPALRIGSSQAGYAGSFFNGAMDDVQLFGRVFAPAEIPGLMNHPPSITSGPGAYAILAGRTLSITNTASDPDTPAQTLTWSLLAPPAGASVDPFTGIFTWRPAVAQAPSTNALALRVADNGNPVMSVTDTLNVTVLSPAAPTLLHPVLASNALAFDVNGDTGPNYALWDSTNLRDWALLWETNPAALPFHIVISNVPGQAAAFYRVQLQ